MYLHLFTTIQFCRWYNCDACEDAAADADDKRDKYMDKHALEGADSG
jgi:hypothetical protein